MARSSPIIDAKKERGELTAERAFRLRLAGASFPEIASTLGITTAAAWKAFRRAMDARKVPDEQVHELRALENQRLDELQMPFVQPARQGDEKALDRVLRIMERRARLNGLDIQRVELSGPDQGSIEVDDPTERILSHLARLARARGAEGMALEAERGRPGAPALPMAVPASPEPEDATG